jgi:adenine-specific DNA-methyltransferase
MKVVDICSSFDQDAEVVLYKGDCLDLLRQIPDQSIQLVVTSPPYNLGKPYESRLHIAEYLEQQKAVITESVRVLKRNGSVCWQVGNYVENGEIIPLDVKLFPIFEQLGLRMRNRIVWHFGHGLHASKRLSGRYEVIMWFTRSDKYVFNLDAIRVPQKYPNKKHFKGSKRGELSGNPLGKNPTDVWEIPNVKANHVEKTEHPCQFPVELIERLVLSMTHEGDWVLDPFIGVGSTAIAALMHGRKAVGADTKLRYIQTAERRIRDAERGELRIRPMNREVFDPNSKSQAAVPPATVRIGDGTKQERLFEKRARYQKPRAGIRSRA